MSLAKSGHEVFYSMLVLLVLLVFEIIKPRRGGNITAMGKAHRNIIEIYISPEGA